MAGLYFSIQNLSSLEPKANKSLQNMLMQVMKVAST